MSKRERQCRDIIFTSSDLLSLLALFVGNDRAGISQTKIWERKFKPVGGFRNRDQGHPFG